MLGTWRLDTKNEGSVFMRQAIDPVTARPVVQQACNSCRAKKLRCTGEKTGCSRCKTLVRECVYAQPAGKGSGRHKRTKVEGKERKSSSVHAAAAKRASRSPRATTNLKPETPPLSVAVASLAAGTASGVEKPTPERNDSHGGAPPDAMSNLGFTMAGPFDMSSGGGPSSPCSIEQWLVGSPPPMDMASTDMDMYLHWPSSLVDPAAFSTMPSCLSPTGTINTMPNPLLSPLSSPTTSTSNSSSNNNNNNIHSSSPNILPSITDDTSTAHSTNSNSNGNTPPTSHDPPTADSLSTAALGGYPPPHSYSPPDHGCCQCLQQVVFLIDELEALQVQHRQTTTTPSVSSTTTTSASTSPRHVGTHWQLDAGLASHKEALRYGEVMLLCAHCTARPESMTILTFLTDRLAGLCERIVEGYLDLLVPQAPASHHPLHENKYQVHQHHHHQQQGEITSTRSLNLNHHHRHATTDTGMPLHSQGQGQGVRWGVYFGDYEVDSPGEWELLVRNLIVLQLRALAGLLGRVKEVAGMMPVPHCDMLWRKAVGTDKRVGALLGRLDVALAGGGGGVGDGNLKGNGGGGGGGGGGIIHHVGCKVDRGWEVVVIVNILVSY
ncbi:hypothetical protein B0T19DRAFT_486949 [Cercophora scortea]|uniref:Zn(2)-C6 fungal-type domain-containing protein n=1 Tax=Cercophora scortea TaxID=314031 RepID=A0AAE0M5Q0_9PEZI|nr:hypothetical protein B0T19DRAFT_486949 [Cercophora scortea]